MVALPNTMGAIPPGGTSREFGTAYFDGTEWRANVRGSLLKAYWADPIQPVQGGKIVVDLTTDGKGLSSAFVVSMYTDQPRPSTGTILTVGVDEIAFTGDDGRPYATKRFLGPISNYATANPIYVTWDAAQPTILGTVTAATPPPPEAPPPPPPVIQTGTETLLVTATDTYGVGGWGRWAGSQNGGEDIYSGTWAGYTLTGSWFYGAPRPALQGKTVTRVQFLVPARLAVGSNNSPVTIHLYAHTSSARPGGDVARVVGPFDVVVDPGFQGGLIDLPLTFAPTLIAGGGISIAGDPYVGFVSRLDAPVAGKLLIDWSA